MTACITPRPALPFPVARIATSVLPVSRWVPSAWRRAWHDLALRLEERDRRRRVARLLDRDDRMLDDMGLDRFTVERSLELPLTVNAIDFLEAHKLATVRRARRTRPKAGPRFAKPVAVGQDRRP